MGRVILCRHGRTDLNKGAGSAERIRGWTDVPLDREGYKEAERLGRHFAGRNVKMIYASPLSRAVETASDISRTTGAPMSKRVSLMPWQLGFMHGQEVEKVIPVMNYYVENEELMPKGGEPFKNFRMRFLEFLKGCIDEAARLHDGENLILVAHSRNMQLTKAWAKNNWANDFTIDVKRMLDYSDESGTGSEMTIVP